MQVECERCETSNWVGLRFCTHCGRAVDPQPMRTQGASPKLVFERRIPDWALDDSTRLFAVYGDLVIAPRRGQAMALEAREDARPRPVGEQPLRDLELLAVGHWLVARASDGLRVLAAPLMRSAQLHALPPLQGARAALPLGTRDILREAAPTHWSARIASMARIGGDLALLVEQSGRPTLRIVNLAPADPAFGWQAGFEVIYELPLGAGPWHIDRGAIRDADELLLVSPNAMVLLQTDAEGERRVLRFPLPPHQGSLRVGSPARADAGLVALADDEQGVTAAFLFDQPENPPLRIITDVPIEGLELRRKDGAVTVVGRAQGACHALNHLVPRFERTPGRGDVANRIEEVVPGGVLYRTKDWEAVRLAASGADQPLPIQERLDHRLRAAKEGTRLWLARADDAGGVLLRVFDWVSGSTAQP